MGPEMIYHYMHYRDSILWRDMKMITVNWTILIGSRIPLDNTV